MAFVVQYNDNRFKKRFKEHLLCNRIKHREVLTISKGNKRFKVYSEMLRRQKDNNKRLKKHYIIEY